MNATDRAVAARFHKAGYEVLSSGWPGLLVVKDGRIVAYEVKGPGDDLRPNQRRLHEVLSQAGITVEVIDEEANLFLKKKPGRNAKPKPFRYLSRRTTK